MLTIDRRSLLRASLAFWPTLKVLPRANISGAGASNAITSTDTRGKLTVSNGILTLVFDKESGLASCSWMGHRKVKDLHSSVELSRTVKSTDYAQRSYQTSGALLKDGVGEGRRITVVNSSDNLPALLQHFTIYENKPFFLTQAEVRSSQSVSTNHISPFVVDSAAGVDIGTASDNRVLLVPFDNDMWFRYKAADINSTGLSSELTAAYDNTSRNGLIFGSVTHDLWKTGIRFSGSNNQLDQLEIFGGMATQGEKSATHDSLPHGNVSGRNVVSPMIFVGYYDDWRDGLEEYGRANSAFQPPLRWNQPIPFGWNSWAAYAGHISYSKYLNAADFVTKQLAPSGFNDRKVVYINFDAFWSRLDGAQLRDALDHLKDLSRASGIECRPGIYMAPFAQWGNDFSNFVEGTNAKYRYQDIVLKKPDGTSLPKLDGGTPLDPTHPGTKARIQTYIRTFKEFGFRYIKLDFLGHATLEGAHWDQAVQTGIQAYNQGMKFLLDEIGDEMFISLSIAPLFPSGYGHARRISCDTMGHISGRNESTEYMLNSLSYGWWSNRSVYIADPDEIPLGSIANQGARNENEGRSRFLSAVISGGMILDSSAFLDDPLARELAQKVYTNPRVNALAGGKAFRPIEGNTGDQAADAFVREDHGAYYLAMFNFSADASDTKHIRLDRIAKNVNRSRGVAVTDVWTGSSLGRHIASLDISLAPAESKLLKLIL